MKKLRQEIDEIDNTIIQLIEQRLEITRQIIKYKQEQGLPITDKKRELEIVDRLKANSTLGKEMIQQMYNILFSESKIQ